MVCSITEAVIALKYSIWRVEKRSSRTTSCVSIALVMDILPQIASLGHAVSVVEGIIHPWICDKKVTTLGSEKKEKGEFTGVLCEGTTLHPTVVASINGEEVRILLDSGAGSSYVRTELLTKLKLKTIQQERKAIEQMYGTVTKQVENKR